MRLSLFQSPLGDLVNGNLHQDSLESPTEIVFQSPLGDLVNGNNWIPKAGDRIWDVSVPVRGFSQWKLLGAET